MKQYNNKSAFIIASYLRMMCLLIVFLADIMPGMSNLNRHSCWKVSAQVYVYNGWISKNLEKHNMYYSWKWDKTLFSIIHELSVVFLTYDKDQAIVSTREAYPMVRQETKRGSTKNIYFIWHLNFTLRFELPILTCTLLSTRCDNICIFFTTRVSISCVRDMRVISS